MRSTEIRSVFLDFFTARGHRRVPSSSLVSPDPELLLTNAGMNQFKPYYLGRSVPEFRRATTLQRCVRTGDLDNVGRTARHVTFFEMLGNFSFGDYFKEETIAWAWELITEGFGLERDRLWVTVYEHDDETERLWRRLGVPGERIQRLGRDDNYWSMGMAGPCGPSAEIHYDRGPAYGPEGGPAVDGERYLELWNLVFMQDVRDEDFRIVGELPARSIDTGLGVDRLAIVLQDVPDIFHTDLMLPVLETVRELAGGGDETSLKIVADHARAASFLIADGVLPSGDGRGYVLRRLMRRAIRHARLLGVDEAVLPAVTSAVVDLHGTTWPEVETARPLIEKVVTAEEEGFARTLRQGSRILDTAIRERRLSPKLAFDLHDTYGFPFDLTVDAARAAGLTVDENAFSALLEERRRRSRSGRAEPGSGPGAKIGTTDFVGYDSTRAEVRLRMILRDGAEVSAAVEGEEVEVILDRSPFYAEAGGQVGDRGVIRTASGAVLTVTDTRPGHVHVARVESGEVVPGEAEAVVDAERRAAVARSHTATHVLHAMLRRVLGEHATQRGSLVDAGRLRFDFTHFEPLAPERLREVQTLVNEKLLGDPEVRVWYADRARAEAAGAVALFGETYGERVRIVDIGDFSRELCGGTHVGHGSQAGPVHLLGESSIGSGVRRIEALTGADALRHQDEERALLSELADLLRVRPDEAPGRLRQRLAELAEARRVLERHRREELTTEAVRLAGHAKRVGQGRLVAQRVSGFGADELRPLAAEVLERCGGVVVLGAEIGGRAVMVAAVGPDLGEPARTVLAAAAAEIGGGAGGSGTVANAGGRRAERLDEALRLAANSARELLGGG
ncbi:alanine--tRNA ligase [Actinoallomurus purpureus]|uniref:alanine--tRNA ligase n=1 Tax=Actinoallomurus purpureus TaxID=478114 RepID=UPI002092EECC|nr:alanine--tRNA ligase [Actinoallomurus purpureus]MCO6010843.1 alanine--tRNA ligase [Actinoallomurus purpureus]